MFVFSTMKKPFISVLAILSVIGVGLSAYLLNQHFKTKAGVPLAEDGICSISETINCNIALQSEYAEFLHVPVAGLGLLFYLLIFFYSLYSLSIAPTKKQALLFCFLLAKISLLATIFMAAISYFKLGGFCPVCMAMYGVNLALFLLFPHALGIPFLRLCSTGINYAKAVFGCDSNLGFKPHFWRHLVVSLLFFVAGGMIIMEVGRSFANAADKPIIKNQNGTNKVNWVKDPPQITLEDIIRMHFEQPVLALNPGQRPHKGNGNAKIKLVEFADFECPFCSRAAELLDLFMKEHKNDIHFIHLNYPLDKSCNPHMQHDLHKNACKAAEATICADQKGKYWEMHNLLFANQKKLELKDILTYGRTLSLEPAWLEGCMNSAATKARLLEDIELAQKVQVSGTPSVFLNGRRVEGWTNKELLEALIKKESEK